jgi:hypothetical protein
MNDNDVYNYLIKKNVGQTITELPAHRVLYSSVKTANRIVELINKIKIDFYLKFSHRKNQVAFNINNLYI